VIAAILFHWLGLALVGWLVPLYAADFGKTLPLAVPLVSEHQRHGVLSGFPQLQLLWVGLGGCCLLRKSVLLPLFHIP
jgi:hypothetical protein